MRLKHGVAISGSHGKTTTTSLVGEVLGAGGLDPTTIAGGRVQNLGANSRLGAGDILVAEADESDGSFLKLAPTLVVITNVDHEHLDHYRQFENLASGVRGLRQSRALLRPPRSPASTIRACRPCCRVCRAASAPTGSRRRRTWAPARSPPTAWACASSRAAERASWARSA